MKAMYCVRPRWTLPCLAAGLVLGAGPAHAAPPAPLRVKLTEWKVELSQTSISAGTVMLEVTNAGSIPHAFEVEGQGIEEESKVIQPGATIELTLSLKPGRYEVYCPVGHDSHKKLGMEAGLEVVAARMDQGPAESQRMMEPSPMRDRGMGHAAMVKGIRVTGGGPVVQILPGTYPFIDSAAPILESFGEQEALESVARNGPYSDNVTRIRGSFELSAWDLGTVRDSVAGTAQVTTDDGAHWKVVIDRVATRDIPHHPKFGGVIMGLYYHGNTGVHTPLVPTINSAVALWAVAHLYRNGRLVTDQAMVHVMLLSRTRRDGDFHLACWDCSANPIEELQLQVTPAPGEAKFDAPGGFLFVNWERSRFAPLPG